MKTLILIISILFVITIEAKDSFNSKKLSYQKINNSKFINNGKDFSKLSLDVKLFTKLELNKIMLKYMHYYYKRKLNNIQKRSHFNIFKEIKSISISGLSKNKGFKKVNIALFLNNKIKKNSIKFIKEIFKELNTKSYNILIKGKFKNSEVNKLFISGVASKPVNIKKIDETISILKYKKGFDLLYHKNNGIIVIHSNRKYSDKTLLLTKKRLKKIFLAINTPVNKGNYVAELKYDKFPIGIDKSKINLKVTQIKNEIKVNFILNKLPERYHSMIPTWIVAKMVVANMFSNEKISLQNKNFLNSLISNSILLLNNGKLTGTSKTSF